LSYYTEKRPWGSFTVLDDGKRFKVKRITVEAGEKLSLQYHNRRSEHWTVVHGVVTVTVGEEVKELKVDESIYIPLKEKHCLANHTDDFIEIIEVQIGDYLFEDDIVRLEDRYGRK
jgi:mannose-6-phosphate isomerase-like protein (cupin superfamily)|tara:strand:- start:1039 stop:1386 length:348 start_codon:yes stop_codon:yes gene_type:complete